MKTEELIDFVFDNTEEEKETIIAYLEEAGIDHEKAKNDLMEWIKQKKAEKLIKKGEHTKELFLKNINAAETEQKHTSYNMAARNMEDLTSADKKIIIKNIDLLNRVEGKESSTK